MEKINSNYLIDDESYLFTRETIKSNNIIDISLHASGGRIEIGGGPIGQQEINSLQIDNNFINWYTSEVDMLDSILDVDFKVHTDGREGDIDFYFDEEIDLGTEDIILGIAITNQDQSRKWWEIILNKPAFKDNSDYLMYGSIHETGHALGLEHPFDNSDNDFYQSQDPEGSAFPEQTVMAYRQPSGSSWPTSFQQSDIEALIQIWGPEEQIFTDESEQIVGSDYSEKILGEGGNDSIFGNLGHDQLFGGIDDDWINGNQGNDVIFGNLGDDQLFGGKDDDWIDGGPGNDRIFGNIGSDQLNGGDGNDTLTGGSSDDRFYLSKGVDIVTDFSFIEEDKIILSANENISIIQGSAGVIISNNSGSSLIIENISLSDFNAEFPVEYM